MVRARLSVVVHVGLGANLGDRAAALREAVLALGEAGVEPLRLSPVYESDYVGPGTQPPYLDAVLEARTSLPPLELLQRAQRIERRFGRPAHTHMRPRTLDLDLLLYGGWTVRHPRLHVPHPRLTQRRFALQPLADLGVLASWPGLRRRLAVLGEQQALRRVADIELAAPWGPREVRIG